MNIEELRTHCLAIKNAKEVIKKLPKKKQEEYRELQLQSNKYTIRPDEQYDNKKLNYGHKIHYTH